MRFLANRGPINANDHVNMSQSTNDVYPTATKIATIFGLSALSTNVEILVKVLEEKAEDFKDLLKLGRTEMQDAVPITLGQEFSDGRLIHSKLTILEQQQLEPVSTLTRNTSSSRRSTCAK